MSGAYRHADATVSAHKGVPVTPSDSTTIPVCRALYVGTTGNLTIQMPDETTAVLFSNVAVGIFPVQAEKILATGTTASNIVALY